MPSRALAVGDPITYAYTDRAVHATVHEVGPPLVGWFRVTPAPHETATAVSQFVDFEGVTWERGHTDGQALLAAHALICSR